MHQNLKKNVPKVSSGQKESLHGKAEWIVVQNLTAQRIFVLSQSGPWEKLRSHWGRTVLVRQLLAVDTVRTQNRVGVFHSQPLGTLGESRVTTGNLQETQFQMRCKQAKHKGELGSWEEGRGHLTIISSGYLKWHPKSMRLCFCAYRFRRAPGATLLPRSPSWEVSSSVPLCHADVLSKC